MSYLFNPDEGATLRKVTTEQLVAAGRRAEEMGVWLGFDLDLISVVSAPETEHLVNEHMRTKDVVVCTVDFTHQAVPEDTDESPVFPGSAPMLKMYYWDFFHTVFKTEDWLSFEVVPEHEPTDAPS